MKEKISVLMSVYNEDEDEIQQAVESIINQTYNNLEIIIVNDNPEDISKKRILDKIKRMDERIIIVDNEKNIGLAMSMNKAFTISTGNIIARMDSDDISFTDRFEKELTEISNGNDLVCTRFEFIDEENNVLQKESNYYSYKSFSKLLPYSNIIHHPTVMFTRRIFEKVNGYRNFPCSQDYDLWLRMMENGATFKMIDDKLLKYRVRSNSISNSNTMKQILTLNYIRKLYNKRKYYHKDNFNEEDYNNYLKSNGLGNKKIESNYYKYKKIEEQSIVNIKEKKYISGIIGLIKTLLGCKYIRNNCINGIKFRINKKLYNRLDDN